jgi:hypothetical protein
VNIAPLAFSANLGGSRIRRLKLAHLVNPTARGCAAYAGKNGDGQQSCTCYAERKYGVGKWPEEYVVGITRPQTVSTLKGFFACHVTIVIPSSAS